MLRHPALKWLLGLVLVAGVGYTLWLSLNDPRIYEVEWQFQPLPIAAGFLLMLLASAATAPLWLIIYRGLGGRVDALIGSRIARQSWRKSASVPATAGVAMEVPQTGKPSRVAL